MKLKLQIWKQKITWNLLIFFFLNRSKKLLFVIMALGSVFVLEQTLKRFLV